VSPLQQEVLLARIPIYDSNASFDSAGNALVGDSAMNLAFGVYCKSKPVRLCGLPQPLNYISYEWLFEGAGSWSFLWFQEFFGDRGGAAGVAGAIQPFNRTARDVLPATPWGREQIEILDGGTNYLKGLDLTRQIDFTFPASGLVTKWFMVGDFAPFARIQIALNTQTGGQQGQGQQVTTTLPRVRVWAHVAGYESDPFDDLGTPYGGENGA
jgi:hypothetical protein